MMTVKANCDVGLFVSDSLTDLSFIELKIRALCKTANLIHLSKTQNSERILRLDLPASIKCYKPICGVPDGANVRNGLIMWSAKRHLFFWDYTRDNTYEAILMAHRMSRKMKVYVDENSTGFYLLNNKQL